MEFGVILMLKSTIDKDFVLGGQVMFKKILMKWGMATNKGVKPGKGKLATYLAL